MHAKNPKEMWKAINTVLPKPGKDSVTTSITPDECNDYFSIIGHNVVSSNITVNDEYKWKLPESIYTFKFSRISVDGVYKLLSALPDRSNNDILDFDAKLLRMTAPIIAPSLTMIFNASIMNSYFVNDWKFAKVLPAYKGKGNAHDKINYRPLSLVMHIAKILERIIQIQLMTYMDEHAFITIDQSAYLKKHSTQTSLHRLIDDILENRNNNEITGLCFLDIQKCFDTIDHTILLDKLSHYGTRTVELRWFQSYLTDRMQRVTYNGQVSEQKEVSIGVPQGTVLGPLLFLLFLNDLSHVISNACINIYADDVVIYVSNTSFIDMREHMQQTMNKACKWYNDNKLVLNASKCNTMLIDLSNTNEIHKLNINCNGVLCSQTKATRYLGVTIDDKLKWDSHLSSIVKRVSFNNARLRRIAHLLPRYILIKIYNTMTVPILDYACTVWGSFSACNLNTIHRLENSAARAITINYDYVDVRGNTLFDEPMLIRFVDRCQYHVSMLMYKAVHGQVPDYLSNNLYFSHEVNESNLRSGKTITLYKPLIPRYEITKNALAYKGPSVWNALPNYMKCAANLQTFKTLYKKYFYQQP